MVSISTLAVLSSDSEARAMAGPPPLPEGAGVAAGIREREREREKSAHAGARVERAPARGERSRGARPRLAVRAHVWERGMCVQHAARGRKARARLSEK